MFLFDKLCGRHKIFKSLLKPLRDMENVFGLYIFMVAYVILKYRLSFKNQSARPHK